MAPRMTGAKDREENSPRSTAVRKNLSLRGEGRQPSTAASSPPNYGREYGGRSVDSPRSGKEMAPKKTGDKGGEENSPRSSAVRKTSL